MPRFGKSNNYSENPEVREVEKRVAKEAHQDQKNLDHAIDDLAHADKAHDKSIKVRSVFAGRSHHLRCLYHPLNHPR